jgi:hypothetical protein
MYIYVGYVHMFLIEINITKLSNTQAHTRITISDYMLYVETDHTVLSYQCYVRRVLFTFR